MLARLPKTTHVISRAPSIAVSATVAMATIMVAAAAYWLWFGLTQRSIGMDEGISILAAESILEHGYPRLPSEFVYNRAYLPHYLLAGSIGGLGLNDFAVMLPALLMALGSLYLVFLFAKDVFGRPWVGVAAAALLVLLDMQTFYATSPRMYMPLQFFTVLAAYSTWRGYIGGETKFQWAAILAAGAAILSHQQGAALVVVLPVSVLMVWWMRGSGRPAINRQLAVAGLIFLAGLAYATVLYKPPQGLQQIVSWNGRPVDLSGLNVDVSRWLDHLRQLDHDVAFSRLLAPVVVLVGARALWKRKNPVNQGVVFTLVFFLVQALAIFTNIKLVGSRFWVALLPIYVLLLSMSCAIAIGWLRSASVLHRSSKLGRSALVLGLVAWGIVVYPVSGTGMRAPSGYVTHFNEAYGTVCLKSPTCGSLPKSLYTGLGPHIEGDDIVVSSNPLAMTYYLGPVDGWLSEKSDGDQFTVFDSPTDEYYGVELIDTQRELVELSESGRRVWVVTDWRAGTTLSADMLEILDNSFDRYRRRGVITVYVNHVE